MADYLLSKTGAQVDTMLTDPLAVSLGGTGQATTRTSVTLTLDTTTAAIQEYKCFYYPYLGIVFFRGWCKLNSATTANSWFTIATIPSGYRPKQNAAIAASVPYGGSMLAETAGTIRVRTYTDRVVDNNIDFSGWWYV